jgi:hypothetical protein
MHLFMLAIVPCAFGQHIYSHQLNLPAMMQETIRLHKNNVSTIENNLVIQNAQTLMRYNLESNDLETAIYVDTLIDKHVLLRLIKKEHSHKTLSIVTFLDKIDGQKFLSLFVTPNKIDVVLSVNCYYFNQENPQNITALNVCFLLTFEKDLRLKSYFVLPLYGEGNEIAYSSSFLYDSIGKCYFFSNSLMIDSASTMGNTKVRLSKILPTADSSSQVFTSYFCESICENLIHKYLTDYKNIVNSPEICSKSIRFIPPVTFIHKTQKPVAFCDEELVDFDSCRLILKLKKDQNTCCIQSFLIDNKIYSLGWYRKSNYVQYTLSIFDSNGNLIKSIPIDNMASKLFQLNSNDLFYLKAEGHMTTENRNVYIQQIPLTE